MFKYRHKKQPTSANKFQNSGINTTGNTQEKKVKEPNGLALLSGPSGTGKTSLAIIGAKQCGYMPFTVSPSPFMSYL